MDEIRESVEIKGDDEENDDDRESNTFFDEESGKLMSPISKN